MALPEIATAQIRASDFDGALRTANAIQNSVYGENVLFDMAKARARAGDRSGALHALALLGHEITSWKVDTVMQEFAVAKTKSGDVATASWATRKIGHNDLKVRALVAIARAQAKVGDRTSAKNTLLQAIRTAKAITEDFGKTRAFLSIIKAQRDAADVTAAKGTLRQLLGIAEDSKNNWFKAFALREIAAAQAQMGERRKARDNFQKAIEATDHLKGRYARSNRASALAEIATAQARAGDIEAALRTCRSMPVSKEDFTLDGRREEALQNIAIVQVQKGNVADALQTARSIEHFLQYKNEALLAIVKTQAETKNFKGALATANIIPNGSRKAQARLIVAAAQAKAGDKKAAVQTAEGIELLYPHPDSMLLFLQKEILFDYKKPETWGLDYEFQGFMTSCIHMDMVEKARDLAAAAMAFWQIIEAGDAAQYNPAFENFYEAVLRKMAEVQVEAGDASGALRWARKIRSPQNRIYAMLGVAEGILQRNGVTSANENKH
ncbi:MAG: hypothetical protein QGD94_01545 [Planctomycetia bacterium]|nr:hypothetical protein [Planctomycetia bacterium]